MNEKMNAYITSRNAEGRTINIVAYMRVWYRGRDNDKTTQLAYDICDRYFDDYTTTTDAIDDATCIMDYTPGYINAGCAAVYYADIETECRRAGFADHSMNYYLKVYNNAIRIVCDYIIRYLEGCMYCYPGIDAR